GVVALGVRGRDWAVALSIAVSSLVLTLLLHSIVFFLAWSMAVISRGVRRSKAVGSPFVANSVPSGPPDQAA
ncbi:MAG: hypothetical protein ACC628_00465, partial [Pirellulaceae bacterium]